MKAHSTRHGGFERWAATYDDSVLQGVFFDRMHGELIRVLRPLLPAVAVPHVVDIGCGTGRLLGRLREALPDASLTGVDVSAAMLEVARGKAELDSVRLEEGSAASLPLGDASVDAAVSTVSFHHWDDQLAGLRDVARVLRPGAPLLLLDVFAAGPLAPLVARIGCGHGAGMRSEAEMLRMFTRAGLAAAVRRRVGPRLSPLGIFVARRREAAG